MPADYNQRVKLLITHTERDLNKFANGLGWTLSIVSIHDHQSYVVFSVNRGSVSHKVGYLYSQSTDRIAYHSLECTVEVIFIYGMGFDSQNPFSQGCKIPVIPDSDFPNVMTDWNMEFLGVKPLEEAPIILERQILRIIEENPLQQIYTHLQSLTSKTFTKKVVLSHASRCGTPLTNNVVNAKAEGVSYLVKNAIDYYDNAATENMTQRLLNLYYGTLALMEAEMLIYGEQYAGLSEIENITKSGHGMMTFGTADSLKDFYVAVLDKGLFQAWLSHRGTDVSGFPISRKKAEKSDFIISLDDLFRHIPELQNVMQETEPDYKPYFLFPSYDMAFSRTNGLNKPTYDSKYHGSYVDFLNIDGISDLSWEKVVIESFLSPITIVGEYRERDSVGWRTYVMHRKGGNHYESYQTHKGLSTSMVISPLFGRTDDWEVFAVMILYALSIIVRYMPNLWARILHGDLDDFKAVLYQFSRVAERELTQIFLEKLTGKKVLISHPQGLI